MAIAVIKYTGSPSNAERIFDFGNGQSSDNILIGRASSNSLYFQIFNGIDDCSVTSAGALIVNVWNTVVVKYTSSNQAMEIRVGDTNVYGACVTARTNRVLANTFVGKSAWADPYLSGNIAGLHAIDTVLSETQIAIVIDNIYKGQDASLQCTACSANAVSSIGSTTETNCECLAESYKSGKISGVRENILALNSTSVHVPVTTMRDTNLVRAKTGKDGWRLVRFLPPMSLRWYSGNDNLAGILPRGTAYDNSLRHYFQQGRYAILNKSCRILHCKMAIQGRNCDSRGPLDWSEKSWIRSSQC